MCLLLKKMTFILVVKLQSMLALSIGIVTAIVFAFVISKEDASMHHNES
jgi:putative flippase GtrA